jgi:hypothetical protein
MVRAALPRDLDDVLARLRRHACNVPKTRRPLDS